GVRRPSRRLLVAVAAAGAAVIVAGAITLLFRQPGGASDAPGACTGKNCSSTTPTTKGAAGSPAGQKLRYRTVDRVTGYFEGTVTIVNKGRRPMPSWTLSFTYPGADVHNAWGGVLQQTGRNVVINSAATAQPIAPGDSFAVRFGGAGTPRLPTDCHLDGRPCTFTG
ncbi:MAG: cellulose-binding family, partial [Actinoallomurus sp.]|nr:cellulose-binding family [Actinoallomurus sp.]